MSTLTTDLKTILDAMEQWPWTGASDLEATGTLPKGLEPIRAAIAELERHDLAATNALHGLAGDARSTDPATSKDAAKKLSVTAKDARGKVLLAFYKTQIIHNAGPLTPQGAITAAAIAGLSCPWKRVSDLKKLGYIEATGETRRGPKGRNVELLTITDHGCGLATELFPQEILEALGVEREGASS